MRLLLHPTVLFALLAAAATACRSTTADPPCPAGASGCVCADGDRCNQGLHCDRGYCVAGTACVPGEVACACLTDGGCAQGASCSAGRCVAGSGPAAGTRGGPCLDGDRCNTPLECVAAQCQDPACPTATRGCPCGTGGACLDPAQQCVQDLCVPAACAAGQVDCVCASGGCEDGSTCTDGLCVAPNRLRLTVGAGAVRACELVLTPGTRRITAVRFPAAVVGEQVTRGGRLGLAFTARSDGALTGTVLELTFEGATAVTPSALSVVESTCFGRTGDVVPQPALVFQ